MLDLIKKIQSINEDIVFVGGLSEIANGIKATTKDIDILKVKDIVYKASNKKFYIDEVEIELTHLEHDLLLEFFKNKDILMTREHLLNSVWQDSFEKKEKTVNVAIKRSKAKIDPDGKKDYIRSIRGEGYIFC